MSSVPVKYVFTKSFSTVNENDWMSECLELFKREMPPVIAVLDDKGKYAGVISRRWVIRLRL
jgi:CBS domain-containing protein